MGGNRLSGRLVAVFMIAVGTLCLWRALGVLRAGGQADSAAIWVLAALLAVAGVACVIGALSRWTEPPRVAGQAAPLFGRGAGRREAKAPVVRPLLAGIAVVAFAALVVDQANPWLPRAAQQRDGTPSPGEAPEGSGGEAMPETPPTAKPEAPAATAPDRPEEAAKVETPPAPPKSDETEQPPQVAEPPVVTAPPPETPVQPVLAEGHREPVVWIDVAADGHSLISASTDRTIKLWDLDDPHLVRDLGQHKDMARTALFMPDGVHAIDAGDDGEIVVRNLADGVARRVFAAGENGGVNKLAISPDGGLAVSGHQTGAVVVWDVENGAALHVLPGHDWSVAGVAISPDGERAVTGSIDGELKLWDIRQGRLLRTWLGHERGAYGIAFTPDGRHLVTGSGDYAIKLWDLDTGAEVRRFEGHSGTVYCIALSKDGSRILSGSLDGTARLWDLNSGAELAQFNPGTGPIYAVAFGPGDSLLTGGYDRAIRHWKPSGAGGAVLFAGAPQ